jgi:hypothetical protein
MNQRARLNRLLGEQGGEDPQDAEKRRQEIRTQAEHANRCQDRYEEPLFEITEEGDVFCARDGRPVTHPTDLGRKILSNGTRVGRARASPRPGGGSLLHARGRDRPQPGLRSPRTADG